MNTNDNLKPNMQLTKEMYESLLKKFPHPIDAMTALEILSALVISAASNSRKDAEATAYRFYRNVLKRIKG